MIKLIQKISLIGLALFSASNVEAAYDRWIQNDSTKTWAIFNIPNRGWVTPQVYFDSSREGSPACSRGSNLINGPCFLEPGQRTFVRYDFAGEDTAFFGYLDFFNLANPAEVIKVVYEPTFGGFSMKSSDESKLNDNHANITIFNR